MRDSADRQQRRTRFEAVFDECYELVLAYARRRAPDDADDIAAKTFLVAWRRIDEVPADALPWLYGVARNVLREERRAHRRRDALVARLTVPQSAAEAREPRSAVLEALARLAPEDREAVLLVAWEGLTASQAAGALDCSVTAFRVRLHRARKRLRRLMREPDKCSDRPAALVAREMEGS